MKKISLIILGIFLINFISAIPICVDLNAPSPPILSSEITGTDVTLTWTESTDIPDCSGIDYYEIARDEIIIDEQITILTYMDVELPYGTYSYIVYAVDKAGHKTPSNEVNAPLESPFVQPDTDTSSSGRSPSGRTNPQIDDGILLTQGSSFTPNASFEGDEEIETFDAPPNIFSRITGAVIGTLGTGGTIVVSIFILGILGSVVTISMMKKRRKN